MRFLRVKTSFFSLHVCPGSLGLVVIIGLSIWLIFRKSNSTESYSNLNEEIGIDPLRNQQTFGSYGTSSDNSIGRDKRVTRPINGVD